MNTFTLLRSSATVTAFLFICACARDGDRAAQSASDVTSVQAEARVDDVTLSGQGESGAVTDRFIPGQPIELSMSVDDSPQGTVVTTYWYGPDNRPIAYESKEVNPGEDRLSFIQDNTFDWRQGTYRAEVWVGDEKVEEESFQISMG